MPYRTIHESEIPIVAGIQAQSFRSDPARYVESYTEGGRMSWRELRLYDDDRGQPVAALRASAMSFAAMSSRKMTSSKRLLNRSGASLE